MEERKETEWVYVGVRETHKVKKEEEEVVGSGEK